MNINCQDCLVAVKEKLSTLPSSWKDVIAAAICDAFTGSYTTPDCEAIKDCVNGQIGNTSISNFIVDGNTVSITYTDINGVTVTRSFNFTEIINNSLNNINPSCLASAEDWSSMTYIEKWQAIIDKVCDTCIDQITTTSTTTTTTLIDPSVTTSTTTTSTSSTSTTTTTTAAPHITGSVEAILEGDEDSGAPVKMTLVFDNPLPAGVQFKWGFDLTSTTGYPSISNYPLPTTYPGGTELCAGGLVTPGVGTTGIVDYSNCNEYGTPYGYVSKIVFYDVILPVGYTMDLVTLRLDLDWEIR